uniref:Uncharacterized protein n=1 Tax=Triticum urartu TaxID=4572 RepID=A0A8R7TNQ3_TRIUA
MTSFRGSGRSVIFYLMLRFHFLATLLVQLKTKFGLQKLLFWNFEENKSIWCMKAPPSLIMVHDT